MSKENEHIRGVFSLQETRKVGTGTTTRKTVMKTFWYVDYDENGEMNIQSMNSNYVPMGTKKPITRKELLAKYSPEMEFYVQTVYPKMRELSESLNTGDEHRSKGENFSAEYEYTQALSLDEENVRANFGIGLTYLEQGEKAKAENIFERLVGLDAAFSPEHKHLFNDFGINLRKSKLYDEAIEFYQRALNLGQEDENLFINMARVYLESKKYHECVDSLKCSLEINPDNEMATKMLGWLLAKKIISRSEHDKIFASAIKGLKASTETDSDNILDISDSHDEIDVVRKQGD